MTQKQRFFVFDVSKCFGCMGCVAACANANETSDNMFWRNVFKLPPENAQSNTVYLSISCNHCENPACAMACPNKAYEKRQGDGVVIHRKDRCMGCSYCAMACPYDAIKMDKTALKCHFCYERLDQGEEPACVATCFGGALIQSQVLAKGCAKETLGLIHDPGLGPNIRFYERGDA